MSKDVTIGSRVFVVHKSYAHKKKLGGRVVLARITSFVNKNGIVLPEFRLIGQAGATPDISTSHYEWFTDIKLAINSIKTDA